MRVILSCLATAIVTLPAVSLPAAGPTVWRSGWTSMAKPEETIACAREIGFNALVFHGPADRMKQWSAMTKAAGIDGYYWFSPIVPKDAADLAPLAQVVSTEDEAALTKLRATKDPKKGGYQFGGEPLPARRDPASPDHDVLDVRLLCFHRPESLAWCRKQISEMLLACPDLAGVGLDFFGYQNYRCCLCPRSLQLQDAYCRRHPDLPREKAAEKFSLDTLVETINELSRDARGIRPGIKVTIHVYPTFLPEPVYGPRLDVDTCCETVAWFFEPYWSEEKVAEHTLRVTQKAGRAFAGSRGVPFVGLYVGRPEGDKPPQRFAEELAIIRRHAGLSALSICSFNEFIKHESMRRVMKEALAADK
ncbi:MAG: hypothetical protein HUU20_17300 [Pirellulales bacterium]|nr:hypothetical protein [Pirellulales bacterium]